MKLTTDVTSLFFSAVNNGLFVHFFMPQVWTIKLTESTNMFCISDRVVCTIKPNIKEGFI